MTKTHATLLLLSTFALTACVTATQPRNVQAVQDNEDSFVLPDIPAEPLPAAGIPYPQLDKQTQIDQIGIQVARLEREIELLNTRIQQIERRNTPKRTAAKPATSNRLNDAKLKNNYLANGGATVAEADSVAQNEIRLYNQALKFYQRGNFTAAAAVLRGADGGNGSEAARRNMYLLLQSQQRMGNCESVIEIGGRYANRFKGTAQAPDALYSIGQCQYRMQQKDIARNTWRKLIQTYPDSTAAKRAAAAVRQR
ncbi:tetratricopeptide repeat protein [Neisseria animalis]|uniref:Tetratricopeptide repeat protein n=1 Tax=Neisseria animalis TaxID=492 RepID=A0A5P3MSX9_NEIAN|nr:tetratricopeptide repeat protein [Neisseria animalis]QEY24717.1 hypothetical protein D0T90_09780 [Neisseria animalis]ROW31689.1 hypothetical protein CGZ60_08945 [Neisseria animalis]VEE07874.1 putative lipoprotein [Neisseria animalis]